MEFVDLENIGKKYLEQFPIIKRIAKRVYQIVSVILSNKKFKNEGQVIKISPDDNYEYFYGYYDKSPWDGTNRYIICIKVKQTYKFVAPKEPGIVGVIDTQNNKFIKIGVTHSWNVQQSCMAQWMGPDYKSRIIYNDFRDGKYCSVIYNWHKRKFEKILPIPVYDLARDGSFALSLDFNRLHRLRPGYGYSNLPDRTKGSLCPDKICIWKMDIPSGKVSGLFKYTDMAAFEPKETMKNAEHKVNHLMISPNGKRFMVLHRWIHKGKKFTRLVTVNVDKTEMYNLSDDDFVSHCFWKNDKEILSFLKRKETGNHYYLVEDKTQKNKLLWPELNTDGHCSYSPDRKFVITDTYPDRKRIASIYLCTEEDNRSRRVARVFSPFKYDNNCRCDLHPRWNRDGTKICIDSVHEGKRGLYEIPLDKIENKILFTTCDQNNSKEEPLVSFIIPVYNGEKTIERCINSIQNQTYDSWEIIVINDGSIDKTAKILEKYKLNNKIKIYNQKNCGPGMARNNGILYATAKYISFLDSDDYMEKEYIAESKKILDKTDADILFYETIYENEFGKIVKRSKIHTYAEDDKKSFIIRQMSGDFSWGACKMIKRSLIEKSNALFSGEAVGEEALFTFKILLNADRIEFLKIPVYHYVQSNQGQHRKGNDDPLFDATKSMKKYILDNELFADYEVALNNMAMKALIMSFYRCSILYEFISARRMMLKKIKEYDLEYNFNNIDETKLNKTARLLLPLIKKKLVTPIYIASKIRNRRQSF